MSGHSKWAKIKRQKGANDQKRGAIFTKLAKNITLAAKEGGGDIEMNFVLRLAVDKAKEANMPSDNIERAIKRGTGEDTSGAEIQRITYEAYGPSGTSLLIDCQTDNTNRTVAEIRKLLENHGGNMVEIGGVSWKFSEKGFIAVKAAKLQKSEKYGGEDTYQDIELEDAQLELMEIPGITDMKEEEYTDEEQGNFQVLELITDKTDFAKTVEEIKQANYKIISAELIKQAKDTLDKSTIDVEKLEKLIEDLEEHDDVDSVWVDVNY